MICSDNFHRRIFKITGGMMNRGNNSSDESERMDSEEGYIAGLSERKDRKMREKKFDVIHIGEANLDITVPDVPDEFFTGSGDTFACGMITDGCGGDAANQALCVASLGDKNAIFVRLDNGMTGQRLYSLLEERGVDTSLIIRDDNCRTRRIIVNVKKDGSHRFLVGKGYDYGLHREDIVPGTLDQTKILAIGSLFVLDSLDREKSVAHALKFCRDAGGQVVADMTGDVRALGPHFYDDIYPLIDFMVPSWDEAFYVTGLDHEEKMADYFLERGVGNVVIKLGSRGSFFKNASERFYTDSYEVKPVDTSGCGDNFTAGFIHAYLKGQSMRECMQFASASGALNSLGFGASSYIRSEKMVLDFMRDTPVRHIER